MYVLIIYLSLKIESNNIRNLNFNRCLCFKVGSIYVKFKIILKNYSSRYVHMYMGITTVQDEHEINFDLNNTTALHTKPNNALCRKITISASPWQFFSCIQISVLTPIRQP